MRDTIQAALEKAKQASVRVYLRRQEIQRDAIQLQQVAAQVDAELLSLDGEIRGYEALLAVPQEPA